ncbi:MULTISPECIES: type II toxin-antitoxin system RelE/ParE family toxin [Aphanothece]|uniref:type II toxin-antitoxin system RelE/ParE family toxin n=1 Tax=Aphanothece TaxID=1121 RepID=UPI0039849024
MWRWTIPHGACAPGRPKSIAHLRGRGRLLARIERLIGGNPGDVKPIGADLSALRIHDGPGYRVCFLKRESALINLLAGEDKSSQAKAFDEPFLLDPT